MDENTLKSLKRKYFLAPLMLWYMKHCNYEKLKPKLIKAGMSHIRNESAEEIAYAQDMFETIFKDYKQEKDVILRRLKGKSFSSCQIRISSRAGCRRTLSN